MLQRQVLLDVFFYRLTMSEKPKIGLLDGKKRENETQKEYYNRVQHNMSLLIESSQRDLEKVEADIEARKKRGEVFPEVKLNIPDVKDRKATKEFWNRLRESKNEKKNR